MVMDAVIFDCDGVLIDSETIAHEVEMRAVKGLGLDFDPEVYRRKFQGLAVKSWRRFLNEDHRAQLGKPLPDLFIENLCNEISSRILSDIRPIDGAVAAVAQPSGKKAKTVPTAPARALAGTGKNAAILFNEPLPAEAIPTDAEKVLQVALLWGDTLINVQHFADGVQLVDEDDAGSAIGGVLEQVAYARGAHSDEHLDELACRNHVHRHPRLAGYSACKQGFSSPRWPLQQHSPRQPDPGVGPASGVFEEIDHI